MALMTNLTSSVLADVKHNTLMWHMTRPKLPRSSVKCTSYFTNSLYCLFPPGMNKPQNNHMSYLIENVIAYHLNKQSAFLRLHVFNLTLLK